MRRLDRMFRKCRDLERTALIAYVTCGDPTTEETVEVISAMVEAGADAVELGVPFSDPIADGPVIQEAAQRALARGTTILDMFDVAREVRLRHPDLPLIAFSYLNPILSLGRDNGSPFEELARRGSDAQIDAVLVTDLAAEDAQPVRRILGRHGIGLVPLVAPTSPPSRMKRIARQADGFIYYVSSNGVTGARTAFDPKLTTRLGELRALTDKPIAVGFGVSTAQQFAQLAGFADGVVVGSAIVRAIAQDGRGSAATRAAAVVRSIRGDA